MNYRNAQFLADGRIDCEIEHPKFGWIPFTCDAADEGAAFDVAALHEEMAADPATVAYVPPTPEEIAQSEADALQAARQGMTMTFAQLLIGLVTEGWITEAEGTAWLVDRTPPAAVNALISSLPAAQQFAALARVVAPSVVLRLDPLVISLGAAQGKTPAEIDTFFLTYKSV